MKKICLLLFLFSTFLLHTSAKQRFTVLQWNIWQEGTMVKGGYDAIINEIVRLKPDFVTFSEVRNYHNSRFCDRIVSSLKEKGETYYSFYSNDTGLLSKHPISDSTIVFPLENDHGTIHRMLTEINGHPIAVYTAHLDYLKDAYYNVRGYHGSTWAEIPKPESIAEVLAFNDASLRDDAINILIITFSPFCKKFPAHLLIPNSLLCNNERIVANAFGASKNILLYNGTARFSILISEYNDNWLKFLT